MYTRSRNNQNYGNVRGQTTNSNTGTPYQNSTFSTQGNFQQSQMSGQNQQGNFKSNTSQNSATFKSTTPVLQQQQQQQQPQQQPQQQQQPQPIRTLQIPQPGKTQSVTQPQQQQQLTSTPQPTRLKPILKQPQQVPSSTPPVTAVPAVINVPLVIPTPVPPPALNVDNDTNVKDEKESMDIDNQEQPKWKRGKLPGYKVNKKQKRLRMNQRLRRALQPKNAIMVLNEMKTGVQFTFPESQAAMPNSLFVVHAEIDGKTYVGQGLSKPLARQNAAENALKCLLLEKMTTATGKAQVDVESDGQSNQVDSSQSVAVNIESLENAIRPSETVIEEQDEVPWSSLASFALYKLFLEWQNQGTVVPVPRPGVSPGRGKKEPKVPVEKDLPLNAMDIHPVMLLNQMKPGLTYVEVNRVGNPPNTLFTLAVEIDGINYNGSAKNKKDAKKMAAKTALTELYGLVYPEEMKMDHTEDIIMC